MLIKTVPVKHFKRTQIELLDSKVNLLMKEGRNVFTGLRMI
jgi:hypothetical protein